MTVRLTLLGAAVALAVPAMASAQPAPPTAPPSPLNAGAQANPTIPPVETPAPPAIPQAATAPATPDAAEQAADAVAAEAQATTPPAAPVPAGPVSLATAADLHAGAIVHDQSGALVGTVESADAGGAVVTTGTARARLQLSSFGRNAQGLVIGLTRAQFEAAAVAAAPPG